MKIRFRIDFFTLMKCILVSISKKIKSLYTNAIKMKYFVCVHKRTRKIMHIGVCTD